MTDEELENLELSQTLDSEENAIVVKGNRVTLREVLTAVHTAQQVDDRWITKRFVDKYPVVTDDVIWELPTILHASIEEGGGGKWLGYVVIVKESLRTLCSRGLVYVKIKFSHEAGKYLYYYGVTSKGKAFVNYNEKESS